MSSLGCRCGHIIRDNTDGLSYKGRVLRDQDDEKFFGKAARELALFMAAVASGRREEWISRHFLSLEPLGPLNLSDEDQIWDFLTMLDREFNTDVYECENCGRLWVQGQPGENQFAPYSPDDGTVHRVLAAVRGGSGEAGPSAV